VAGVTMYCTRLCGYCRMAIRLLEKKGVGINKIQVDDLPEQWQEMTKITGRTTVPQIFINDRHVGGYNELVELDIDGELDELLSL